MSLVKLVQTQLSALGDRVVGTTTIGEFKDTDLAVGFLTKRGYTFDDVRQAWINGNTVQYPVKVVTTQLGEFDIRRFV